MMTIECASMLFPPVYAQQTFAHHRRVTLFLCRYFKSSDPSKLTRAKRRVRIEPLYDRFNPPDQWRLTKRRG
jgi:hypothetical protein